MDFNYHSSLSYDTDDCSCTSSVFEFTCNICQARAVSPNNLESQFLEDVVCLEDLDHDVWVKCDYCGCAFHKTCCEMHFGAELGNERFVCCKYI